MIKNKINICGITPTHCFPECFPPYFTQFCETDRLSIVGKDPEIEELVEVSLTIRVREFRKIVTPLGKKIMVHAVKQIQLIFKNSGVKYVSEFCIPFCAVILLDGQEEEVTKINVIIEDIDVFEITARCVALSAFIVVIPECKAKQEEWQDEKTIRCDIKLKSC